MIKKYWENAAGMTTTIIVVPEADGIAVVHFSHKKSQRVLPGGRAASTPGVTERPDVRIFTTSTTGPSHAAHVAAVMIHWWWQYAMSSQDPGPSKRPALAAEAMGQVVVEVVVLEDMMEVAMETRDVEVALRDETDALHERASRNFSLVEEVPGGSGGAGTPRGHPA